MVKNILASKKKEFEYFLLDDMNLEDQEKYKQLAEENNQLQFPLIVENEILISIQDIV